LSGANLKIAWPELGSRSLIKLETPGDDRATHIATASPPER
jgi:hypothetical protein